MNEFKSIIKKKGMQKTIIYFILIFIMLLPLIIMHKQVIGAFQGTCIADEFSKLEVCQKSGRYTKIQTENIYDVGIDYVVDGKTVGKYLDVDLGGNVILTLADTTLADELLASEGLREISGQFSSFNSKVFGDALIQVQAAYIERFANEAQIITEEQTKAMFFGYLFNQYDGRGIPYIIPVIAIGIVIILLIFKVIEGIKMIIKPEKYIIYGKKTLEKEGNADKAALEYGRGPYLFKNTYHKINEASWMYEKGIRRYGMFETGKKLIIKFKDKVGLALPLTLTERKKVMEILRVKNPKIVKEYSVENEQKYKKDPANMK